MDKEKRLYRAFLTLKSPKEVESFLKDLCTASETKDFADRLEIAVLLEDSACPTARLPNGPAPR